MRCKMIKVSTEIQIRAPIEICFDLARNIDIHTETVWKHTKERAISGRVSGMIKDGETVTFEATHFFIRQTLTSKIEEFERPNRFIDEMVSGAFKSMRHEHIFLELDEKTTLMKDILYFEAPFGILGRIVERLVLKPYMKRFIEYRNQKLKEIAEK
jgi:ligand-binding SRPBCC domain-containing protein